MALILDILAWVIMGFTLMRLSVSLVNWLSPLYLKPGRPTGGELVSLLIPARNEADNLRILLPALLRQSYPHFELIVYDDHSADATSQVLRSFSRRDRRVTWIQGGDLPGGWSGKNYACHQLAQQARGDYMLFMDADVSVATDLLEKALHHIHRRGLALLSIFPHQKMKTPGEWLTVPLMNWILLTLLPLVLVKRNPRPAFAAANGQFMLFDATLYRQHQWHQLVPSSLVEDIQISRLIKQKGYTTQTLLGNNDIMCRMYSSFKEGVHGFAKNVTEFFGGSSLMTLIFVFMTSAGVGIIPVALGWQWFIGYVAAVAVIRVLVSAASRQSVLKNLVYHIPQMVALIMIAIEGIKVRKNGVYQWKGRSIEGSAA